MIFILASKGEKWNTPLRVVGDAGRELWRQWCDVFVVVVDNVVVCFMWSFDGEFALFCFVIFLTEIPVLFWTFINLINPRFHKFP